jgi:hypothetical protein
MIKLQQPAPAQHATWSQQPEQIQVVQHTPRLAAAEPPHKLIAQLVGDFQIGVGSSMTPIRSSRSSWR